MSEDTFRWIVAGGVILAALCLVVQAIVVIILAVIVKKTQAKVLAISVRAEPIIDSVRKLIDENGPKFSVIATDATDIVKMGKEQVARLSDLVQDVTDRAKIQVARLDVAVDDTVEQVHHASGAVRTAILKPVREVSGVLAGMKAALSVYTQGRRSSVDHATQDEEMFI